MSRLETSTRFTPFSVFNISAYERPWSYTYEQSYYMFFGVLSAIGNLYLIFLFALFSKLRTTQCNWLIVFMCIADVMIGVGVFIKALIYLLDVDYYIDYDFYWCTVVTITWIGGYRIGQTIALLIAVDRLLAIAMPAFYMKRQGNIKNIVIVSIFIIFFMFSLLVFFFVYGADLDTPINLILCFYLQGTYYFQGVATISGIVSIVFFITYSASLIIFYRHFSATKKQQFHAQKQLSRIQTKIFISVSMAMVFFSIVYVLPTICQLLTIYFRLPTSMFTYAMYIIFYGAELNGFLSAVIYLTKHQEFKECSQKLIYGIRGKTTTSDHNNTSKVFKTVRTNFPGSVYSAHTQFG